MLEPRKVEDELTESLHTVEISHRTTPDKEKRYEYTAEIESYRTFTLLKRQVRAAEASSQVPLRIEGIKPTVHMGDAAIEARVAVTIEETENRNEVENRSLEYFGDQKA